MTPQAPRISILMPVFNADRYLEQSLRSILDQTFRDFELIAIDDGSTDETVNILNSFHDDRIVVVINESRLGLPESLNKGILLAKGEYIARMDADDIADERRLELQHRFLVDNPDAGIVSSKIILIDGEGRTTGKWRREYSPEEIYYNLHFNNIIAHSTIMGKKSTFLEFKGYDSRYDKIEDLHLWQRISKQYALVILPRYLLKIRVHAESVSLKNLQAQQVLLDTLVRERLESLLREPLDPQVQFILRNDNSGFSRLPAPYPDRRQILSTLDLLWRANRAIVECSPGYASKTRLEMVGNHYFDYITAFSLTKSPFRDCLHVLRTVAKKRKRSLLRPFFTLLLLKLYYQIRRTRTQHN